MTGKDFWEKSAVDSAATLRVKNCQNHSISEISRFLRLSQKFKMAAKSGQENVFWQKSTVDSPHIQRVKNFVKITLSLRFRDKQVFAFNAEIQDGRQKWWENNFF